ncbi:hypothetical protein HDU98_010639, partial [Podochytrium sp. JEL0797]
MDSKESSLLAQRQARLQLTLSALGQQCRRNVAIDRRLVALRQGGRITNTTPDIYELPNPR